MDKPFGTAKGSTDRRSFLKSGALVAAPLAVAAPVAALAADDSRAKLARLEDERAIEALHRRFLRHVNGAGDASQTMTSGALDLGEGLRSVAEDMHQDVTLELSDDSLSATARCTCLVEREIAFTGDTTVERMARFQGQGSHRHTERRVLATHFAKSQDGWRVVGARFA
jgi:hypothetical protein